MANRRTQLVHSGRHPEQHKGAVNTPVVRTSTILFKDYAEYDAAENGYFRAGANEVRRHTYGRHGTDTRHDLEDQLAALAGAERTFLCPSGLSAVTFALMSVLKPGDHLLMVDTAYGPTRAFCDKELKRLGIDVTYYDPMAGAGIAHLFRETTRAVYVESPGSITFEVQDIPAIAEVAHRNNIAVLADDTWGTFLAPSVLGLGVDIAIQSLTKYAGGHSDILMGSVSASGAWVKQLERTYKLYGYSVSPDDCYLVQRGMRTLAVRLEQQEKNGLALAEWLRTHPKTQALLHPAFPSCPGHEHWKRDIGRSCGLFAIIVPPCTEAGLANLLDNMRYFAMGFSWGGYESLMIPLNPANARTATRWPHEGQLLRIHAGLEHVDDLIADLDAGLKRLG